MRARQSILKTDQQQHCEYLLSLKVIFVAAYLISPAPQTKNENFQFRLNFYTREESVSYRNVRVRMRRMRTVRGR